jgi:hypothetical protein
MASICVCMTYADAVHLDMQGLYMFLSFLPRSEKAKVGSPDRSWVVLKKCRRWKQGNKLI